MLKKSKNKNISEDSSGKVRARGISLVELVLYIGLLSMLLVFAFNGIDVITVLEKRYITERNKYLFNRHVRRVTESCVDKIGVSANNLYSPCESVSTSTLKKVAGILGITEISYIKLTYIEKTEIIIVDYSFKMYKHWFAEQQIIYLL